MRGTSITLSDINIYLFRMVNDQGKEYTMLNLVMMFVAEYTVFFSGISGYYFLVCL